MKKQRWSILKDTIKNRKRDFLFYIPIVFFSATLFSLCMYFISGNTIETSLANALDLNLSYKNEGFYSEKSENTLFVTDASLNQNITKMYLSDLDQLCSDEDLEYANYTIAIDTTAQINTIHTTSYLYGLRDTQYFDKNGIQLIGCQADDLSESAVLLPIHAKQEGIQIGDTYTIQDPFDPNNTNMDLRVIGFYEDDRWALSSEDTIVKNAPAIVKDSTILSLLEKYPYYYGSLDEETGTILSPIEILNIAFSVKDIQGYSQFVEKFNAFSLDENRKFSRKVSEGGAQAKLGLQTNVSVFGSLLKSIQRIRYIYEFIFLGIWGLSVISLLVMTIFIQKKNAHDIGIRKALGEKKRATIGFYVKVYLITSFVFVGMGTAFGYVASVVLKEQIYKNILQMQTQMNTLTGQTMKMMQTKIVMDHWQMISGGVISIVSMLGLICIAVCFTTLRIIKQNSRKQMRGAVYE